MQANVLTSKFNDFQISDVNYEYHGVLCIWYN